MQKLYCPFCYAARAYSNAFAQFKFQISAGKEVEPC
jgi:hypothetical protein